MGAVAGELRRKQEGSVTDRIISIRTKSSVTVPGNFAAETSWLKANGPGVVGDWYHIEERGAWLYAWYKGKGEAITIPLSNVGYCHREASPSVQAAPAANDNATRHVTKAVGGGR